MGGGKRREGEKKMGSASVCATKQRCKSTPGCVCVCPTLISPTKSVGKKGAAARAGGVEINASQEKDDAREKKEETEKRGKDKLASNRENRNRNVAAKKEEGAPKYVRKREKWRAKILACQ